MPKIKAGLVMLLFMPLVASAINCGDLTTQSSMNQCAAAEYKKSDQALNQAYIRYRSRLDEEQKHQLMEVQRAWISFRDLNCEFKSSGILGSSAHPFALASCMTEMTEIRVRELQELKNCKEGDLLCPSWR